MCGFPELYARYLIFEQTAGVITPAARAVAVRRDLLSHTAWAAHDLRMAFGMPVGRARATDGDWSDAAPDWVAKLEKRIRLADGEILKGSRTRPDWTYFTSHRQGISIVQFPIERAFALRWAFVGYEPRCVDGEARTSIAANGLHNAVSNRTLQLGRDLLHAVEAGRTLPWVSAEARPRDRAIVVLPLETHCLFIGLHTVISVRTNCGLRAYESERSRALERQAAESVVFYADAICGWIEPLSDGRFEELIYALLEREPGFTWVRSSGPTRERDGGRDLLAIWVVAPPTGGTVAPGKPLHSPVQPRRIVVQVKAQRKSVGKSKVPDIRDTLERHRSSGFFLVAFPQPANSLVTHLEHMAESGTWTDWWDRVQIETRLRRHPDIAARFPDLVHLTPPPR